MSNKDIPKKFAKSKRSFIEKLGPEAGSKSYKAFCVFPKGISFNGQDEGEHVILIVRKHPAKFIPQYLLILFLVVMPLILVTMVGDLDGFGFLFAFGTSLLFIMLAITVAIDTFFKWFYSVNIVTDQRIVDVDFNHVLYHRFSETQLENVEDVSHSPIGILSSIFDYGDLFIQTAGTQREFEFDGIPRPRDVQDTILDLLEMKQKGEI